jgi:hypothetical protein
LPTFVRCRAKLYMGEGTLLNSEKITYLQPRPGEPGRLDALDRDRAYLGEVDEIDLIAASILPAAYEENGNADR